MNSDIPFQDVQDVFKIVGVSRAKAQLSGSGSREPPGIREPSGNHPGPAPGPKGIPREPPREPSVRQLAVQLLMCGMVPGWFPGSRSRKWSFRTRHPQHLETKMKILNWFLFNSRLFQDSQVFQHCSRCFKIAKIVSRFCQYCFKSFKIFSRLSLIPKA